MKVRGVFAAAALATTVVACGGSGVGAGGGSAPGGGTAPPGSRNYQVFFVITTSAQRRTEVVPAGTAPVPPPGGSVGGPVPGAVVTYPNGTTQIADANGVFNTLASSYVQSYIALIATSPVTQPHVKAATPSGSALASSAYVSGYAASTIAQQPVVGAFLLPTATELFAGGQAVLHLEGTDIEDLEASLSQDDITWSSLNGATVTPIPQTAEAVYNAPNVSGASVVSDVVTATIHVPNSPVPFTTTAQVVVFGPGAGFNVSGTLATATGSTVPGGTALFVQDDKPRIFPSFNWFAQADANGNYQGLIPANTDFSTAIGAPAPSAPGGTAAFLPAFANATGDTSFTSLGAGQSATVNLAIDGSAELDDTHDDANAAYPPPIARTRDAWYATAALSQPYPYDADSGVLPLLAAVPSTFPSPVAPALVGSGLLARWCYQWINAAGTPTLVVVDNTSATSCSQPGDTAFAITPQAQAGSYAFVQYVLPAGAYTFASPLNPAPAGAMLVTGGNWGGPTNSASVQLAFYDPLDQVLAAPLYVETFQYGYASNGGLATVTITNANLTNPLTGHLLQSIPSATVNQIAPLAGANGCVQTSAQPALCYDGTATVTRYDYTQAGTVTHTFAADAKYYGDGSSVRTFASTSGTDVSEVVLPVAGDGARVAGSCFVCNASGSFFDTDGTTQIGTVSIATDGVVMFELLNTSEGATPGSPYDALTFIF